MFAKIMMIVLFFVVTVGIGLYYHRRAGNVGDFVLGGRNVGPWVTAFACYEEKVTTGSTDFGRTRREGLSLSTSLYAPSRLFP